MTTSSSGSTGATATVKASAAAWAVAVAAGVAETVLVVTQLVGQGKFGPADWADVGFRLVVYAVATSLVVGFSRGRRWARPALTVLLTGIGLASLVVPAAMAMASGQSFVEAFSDGGRLGWAFVTVRLLHIAAVVSASVLMYTPSANRHFAGIAKRRAAAIAGT